MSRPKNYKYSKEHEWIEISGSKGTVGVTDFAIEQLGDIVHIELPSPGKTYAAGDSFGTIESTKTVSDLYMPVGGKVLEVNQNVKNSPESLQTDALSKGWLVKIELGAATDTTHLMDEARYDSFTKE